MDNFHPALAKFKCLLTSAFATLYTSRLGRKLTMTMRLVRWQKELLPPAAGEGRQKFKSCQVDLETPF